MRVERENTRKRERRRKGENKRATSGTPRAASRALETLPVLHLFPCLSLSLSLQTVPSAQKTRRFIAKERRENVDLSSYVPAWQFVCPRTLRRERLPGARELWNKEGKRERREREREREKDNGRRE